MKHRFSPTRRSCLRLLGGTLAAAGLGTGPAIRASDARIRRRIPGSDESLPVIGVGTSRVFDVGPDEMDGPREVLGLLSSVSGAMIDTSPMYGEAERVTGKLVDRLGLADRFFYATKVWTDGRDAGIAQMNRSFELLGRETVDLMQIHNLVDWQTHLHTLREWKDAGRIRHIGITHYHAGAHRHLASVLTAMDGIDFLQVNYSLLETEAADRLLPLARDRGVAVIVNRPFARGNWFRLARGHELPPWAAELDIGSWAQFALKWIVAHPAVTVAIPGTGKARHMADNLGAAQGTLPDEKQRRRMLEWVSAF